MTFLQDRFLNNWKGQFLLAFVLTIVTLVIFYSVFNIYLESSERWVASVIYGNFTAPPYGIWFTDNHFLQIPVLSYLASIFPNLPVYGIWYILLTLVYTHLWFFLFIRILNHRTNKNLFWIMAMTIPLIWAILGASLVYSYFMRVSILLSSVSLLLYLDYYTEEKKKFIFIVFFLIGCSMRTSSGIMVLSIMSVLVLLQQRKIIETVKILWLPWLLASACMCAVLLNKAYSGNKGAQIDQIFEYALSDRQAIQPISTFDTKEDSLRYRGVKEHGLITDSTQISLSFVNRLVDHEKLNLWGINQDDISHFWKAFSPWLQSHKWILVMLYLTLFILCYGQTRRLWIMLFIIHLAVWGVVIFIGLKISMYDYFIEPWLAMLFGISYFIICRDSRSPFLWGQKIGAFVLPIIACSLLWPLLRQVSITENEHNKQVQVYLNRLEQVSQNNIPIIWVDWLDFLPSDIYARKETEVFKRCEYMRMDFWAYYPFASERCEKRLGFSPLDWRGLERELRMRQGYVCFVMDERLAEFLTEYYQTFYGLKFELKRDISQPEVLPEVFVFRF